MCNINELKHETERIKKDLNNEYNNNISVNNLDVLQICKKLNVFIDKFIARNY